MRSSPRLHGKRRSLRKRHRKTIRRGNRQIHEFITRRGDYQSPTVRDTEKKKQRRRQGVDAHINPIQMYNQYDCKYRRDTGHRAQYTKS